MKSKRMHVELCAPVPLTCAIVVGCAEGGGSAPDGSGGKTRDGAINSAVVDDGGVPDASDAAPATPQLAYAWGRSFETTEAMVTDVASDRAGHVSVVGKFAGHVVIGDARLESARGPSDFPIPSWDGFVAKLDSQGAERWSRRIGGDDADGASGVVSDLDGNVIVCGVFTRSDDLGVPVESGGAETGEALDTAHLVKLDADGRVLWARGTVTGEAFERFAFGADVAVDAAGNAIVIGLVNDAFDWGLTPIVFDAWRAIFVAKYRPDGERAWVRVLGGAPGAGENIGWGPDLDVTTDVDGNVWVAGSFVNAIKLGEDNGEIVSAGQDDVFVAKLDPDGAHIWSATFGEEGRDRAFGIASDALGAVFLTGDFDGSIDFGGGKLRGTTFVVKLDGEGRHVWSHGYMTAGSVGTSGEDGGDVVVNSQGDVLITGMYRVRTRVGGCWLTDPAGPGIDLFIARYDTDGTHRWSHRFGGVMESYAPKLAVAGDDAVYFGGGFVGAGLFNPSFDDALPEFGWPTPFVVKLVAQAAAMCGNACGGCPELPNGASDYCDVATCIEGEGHCEGDAECLVGVCGRDNGRSFGFDEDTRVCWAVHCENEEMDYDETDVDCGGSCGACLKRAPPAPLALSR